MEKDPHEKRLQRIEGKLRLLVVLSIIQSSVIAFLVVCLFLRQFLPSTPSIIMLLAAIAVFFYLFRAQIPSWFGSTSRFVFSQLFAATETDIKDAK